MTKLRTKTQYLTTFCVNILSLGVGASISWTSPYLPQLKGEYSPLPVTVSEASWIGSILAIGALIGSFFYGWLSEKVGRFWSLQLCSIPQIIWWSILIFSPNVTSLMIGRFLAGLSTGGAFTLIPLYVTEISQDAIRGSLGSFFVLVCNGGMLLMYTAGNFFDYFTTPRIMILLPMTFTVIFSFFPETPYYLLRSNKFKEAEEALKFFRCSDKGEELNESEKLEMQNMKKKIEDDKNKSSGSIWRELKSPSAVKGVVIGVMLISFNQLSGFFMFLNYTADLFIESGSNFTPNQSAFIIGVILVLGSILSLGLVNRYSRKVLYTVTSLGPVLGLLMIGIYNLFKVNGHSGVENFKFIPVTSLSIFIFIGSLGRVPLTYVMMSEIMPQKIRSLGISIAITCNWVLCFLLLRFFSFAVKTFQFHNCMFIFSVVIFMSMIFVMIYVPETKNKSFDDIEKSLGGLKMRNEDETQNSELKNLKQ